MAVENTWELQADLAKAEGALGKYLDATRDQRTTLPGLIKRMREWVFKGDRAPPFDPVRIKNLQKCTDYVHRIIEFQPFADGTDSRLTRGLAQSVNLHLIRLEEPASLSADSAWELADALYGVLIWLGTPSYVCAELRVHQKSDEGTIGPNALYTADEISSLVHRFAAAATGSEATTEASEALRTASAEARESLRTLHNAQVDEYRRDRAKIRLRATYLGRMAAFLTCALVFLCYFYVGAQDGAAPVRPSGVAVLGPTETTKPHRDSNESTADATKSEKGDVGEAMSRDAASSPTATAETKVDKSKGLPVGGLDPSVHLLLLVLFAGATGSVLSRAIKLSKQPLHASAVRQTGEPPLGLRELMSGWSIFLAQPVIGACAAAIVFLVFKGGLIQIGGLTWSVEACGTLGFLAGFSEPFFLGILDSVSNESQGRPK